MKEKILIVDDDEMVAEMISVALKEQGYQTATAGSATQALAVIRKNQGKAFNLVLADLVMPVMSGTELLEHLRNYFPDIGVIMVSAENNVAFAVEAMRKGAIDFITKPVQLDVVLHRVQKALERLHLERENRDYQKYLEEKIESRTAALIDKHRSLQKLYINTVEAIARAIEAKDPYTQGHSKRVSKYCARMAARFDLSEEDAHDVEIAGLLHDVGKIGISDAILGKASKLTIEEYEEIKEHPLISLKIIDPIQELKHVKDYVKYHHEKWDGTGYPEGLKGEGIPLGARILSVADAFDTMWIGRQYHAAWDLETVIKEFEKNRWTQFDGQAVDNFVILIREDQASFDLIRRENPPRFSERV